MKNFCTNCGEKLSPENNICPKCGLQIKERSGENPAIEKIEMKPRKGRTAFFIIAFLVMAIFAVVNSCFSPKPTEQTLVDEVISVPAGKHYRSSFSVSRNAVLIGDYRAFGGSGNDIKVLLMDEDSYINWVNGHQANVFYNSGQITVGKINVSLKPGKYCLILSNDFSMVSGKNVEAHIKLIST